MKTPIALLLALSALTASHSSPSLWAAAVPEEAQQSNYVIVLDETPAGQPYKPAAEALAQLRAPAARVPLRPDGLGPVFKKLKQLKLRFVAFVVPPGRIEDNFVGEVFEQASRLEAGPELDFAYGYITGATPQDARMWQRSDCIGLSDEKSANTISR